MAKRFLIAGIVIALGGVAIAVTGEGVGEGAVWKGGIIAAMGLTFVVSGLRKVFQEK